MTKYTVHVEGFKIKDGWLGWTYSKKAGNYDLSPFWFLNTTGTLSLFNDFIKILWLSQRWWISSM